MLFSELQRTKISDFKAFSAYLNYDIFKDYFKALDEFFSFFQFLSWI